MCDNLTDTVIQFVYHMSNNYKGNSTRKNCGENLISTTLREILMYCVEVTYYTYHNEHYLHMELDRPSIKGDVNSKK